MSWTTYLLHEQLHTIGFCLGALKMFISQLSILKVKETIIIIHYLCVVSITINIRLELKK